MKNKFGALLWPKPPSSNSTAISVLFLFFLSQETLYKSGKENKGPVCLWLWSKISCFDLLIWSKQAHGWRSLDDTREAHASCPGFRKVCRTKKKKNRNEKENSHYSSEKFSSLSLSVKTKRTILESAECLKHFFNDAPPHLFQHLWTRVGLQIRVCVYSCTSCIESLLLVS